MSSSSRPASRGIPSHKRPPHLLRWIAVICVVAVVAEVGWVTSGFGVAGLFHKGGGSGSSVPDLNPGDEKIVAVVASITWSGKGTNPFPSLNGGELCGPCPLLPRVNDNVTPAVDGLWVYFNVTNSASNSSQIRNLTLSTSGSDATLFALSGEAAGDGLYCCYASHYGESVAGLLFGAGQTWGVAIFVYATSIPYDGSAGYSLTVHLLGS